MGGILIALMECMERLLDVVAILGTDDDMACCNDESFGLGDTAEDDSATTAVTDSPSSSSLSTTVALASASSLSLGTSSLLGGALALVGSLSESLILILGGGCDFAALKIEGRVPCSGNFFINGK